MYNLVIVGAGQLGSRHLQGLALLNCEANIYVVDKSQASLDIAKQRFEEVEGVRGIGLQAVYLTDLQQLPEHIDVAIIATTSDTRRDVVASLIEQKRVSYFILEKVLFNRLEDYEYIQNLLSVRNIKSWVNCNRRYFNYYQQLKTLFQGEASLQLTVEGKNWGLGCNAIHFIDLLAFVADCKSNLIIDTSEIDREILQSKRAGFVEFTGALTGAFESENTFRLISNGGEGGPEALIKLSSPNYNAIIDERKGEMTIERKSNDWAKECFYITVPFQSQLTNKVVEDILITGNCSLSTYEESMSFHLPLIKGLSSKMGQSDSEICICNIT